MRSFGSAQEMLEAFRPFGEVRDGRVTLTDAAGIRGAFIDDLAYTSALSANGAQADARWLIWELAQQLDCRPASIHEYYLAGGQNRWSNQTTPAINVRAMAYDTARAIFRAASQL
jgi:hypothetical protein